MGNSRPNAVTATYRIAKMTGGAMRVVRRIIAAGIMKMVRIQVAGQKT
ncbi:Uncharacterised protein [uncultured archaeon]|nr:Uncharacterised protein [uncultured archaeon]